MGSTKALTVPLVLHVLDGVNAGYKSIDLIAAATRARTRVHGYARPTHTCAATQDIWFAIFGFGLHWCMCESVGDNWPRSIVNKLALTLIF